MVLKLQAFKVYCSHLRKMSNHRPALVHRLFKVKTLVSYPIIMLSPIKVSNSYKVISYKTPKYDKKSVYDHNRELCLKFLPRSGKIQRLYETPFFVSIWKTYYQHLINFVWRFFGWNLLTIKEAPMLTAFAPSSWLWASYVHK